MDNYFNLIEEFSRCPINYKCLTHRMICYSSGGTYGFGNNEAGIVVDAVHETFSLYGFANKGRYENGVDLGLNIISFNDIGQDSVQKVSRGSYDREIILTITTGDKVNSYFYYSDYDLKDIPDFIATMKQMRDFFRKNPEKTIKRHLKGRRRLYLLFWTMFALFWLAIVAAIIFDRFNAPR